MTKRYERGGIKDVVTTLHNSYYIKLQHEGKRDMCVTSFLDEPSFTKLG